MTIQSSMELRPTRLEDNPKGPSSYFSVVITKKDGTQKLVSDFEHNVFPAACIDLIHTDMFTTTSKSGSGFNFIALTANTGQTVDADQTALTGEITTNGLSRVQATTRTHGAGTSTSLIEHTFTLSGTQSDITRAALFNLIGPPVAGTMGPFAAFTNGATGQMVSGETVKVSVTITTS